MRDLTAQRHLDAGQPVIVRHENEPGFMLEMRACSEARCSCHVVDLHLAPEGDFDDDAPHIRVSFDVQSREVKALHDQSQLLRGTCDEPWLRSRLANDLGQQLADRFARLRASKDRRAWQAYDWSRHVAGDMVAFHELFPHDWDIVVSTGTRRAWLVDQYCVRPGCACQDVALHVVRLEDDPISVTGDAVLRLRGDLNLAVVRCDPAVRPLVDEALLGMRVSKLLQRRFREVRDVARLLRTWRTDINQPEEVVATLLASRAELDRSALDRIHALGARGVAPLAAVVLDTTAPDVRRIRAARLLAAVDEPESIEALAAAVAWPGLDADQVAVDDVLDAIVHLRISAVEPLLAALPIAGPAADRVADVLGDLRITDPRVLATLAERARREPSRWLDALAWQGEAAIPVVQEILASILAVTPLDCDGAQAALDVLDDLGVDVDVGVIARVEAAGEEADAVAVAQRLEAAAAAEDRRAQEAAAVADRRRTAAAALAEFDRRPRPGRNQPCWCGRDEKYKNCHLAGDEEQRRALTVAVSAR